VPLFLKKSEGKNEAEEFWKIIVVDDEPDVHAITSVVARDIVFDGKKIKLYSAFSSEEAKRILSEVPDLAVAIIDIVMENDNSGIELVKYIREELKNNHIRIVIRTGQPGFAPPREIVSRYDINDYREKAELSSNGLYTMLVSRLREYRDIVELDVQKRLLERSVFYSSILLDSATAGYEDLLYNVFDDFGKILGMNVNLKKVQGISFDDFFDKKPLNTKVSWEDGKSVEFYVRDAINSGKFLRAEFSKQVNVHQAEIISIFLERFLSEINNYVLSKDLIDTLYKVIYIISEVTETRSLETGEHVRRVGKLSRNLAHLLGYDGEYLEFIEIGSMLHDVGKIGIPDAILNKPSRLSDAEFEIMKGHTVIGYNILSIVEHPLFQLASNIALYHHENWDGTGYPKGLKGEDIPLEGRIVSLVDVYDALSFDRIYRPAWREDEVLKFIEENSGKKFDPKICEVFFDNYEDLRNLYLK